MLAQRDNDDLARPRIVPTPIVIACMGHVFFAEEVAGRVLPGHRVERDHPRAAVARAARLVEADVPRAADAQNLQVDAAGLFDGLLVGVAERVDVAERNRPVGNVDVFGPEC